MFRPIEGSFEIELGDIKGLYYLIEERVSQQNKGLLGQFTTKIIYDDSSSVLLSSIESLSNYSENRAITPVRVECTWQYLIKFQDKNVPEKQEIEVRIFVARGGFSILRMPSSSSGFSITIKHTARTWATDIELMLAEHCKNLLLLSPRRSKLSTFVDSNKDVIGVISGVLFFLLSVLGGLIATNKLISSNLERANELRKESIDVNVKIDFLLNSIVGGENSRFYFFLSIFLLLMLVASVFVGTWIAKNAKVRRGGSYILLTKKVRREKEADLKAERNRMKSFFISAIASLFINLISSYVFLYATAR